MPDFSYPPYFPAPPDDSIAVMVDISTLPTTDPHVANAPWNNGGFVCVSFG